MRSPAYLDKLIPSISSNRSSHVHLLDGVNLYLLTQQNLAKWYLLSFAHCSSCSLEGLIKFVYAKVMHIAQGGESPIVIGLAFLPEFRFFYVVFGKHITAKPNFLNTIVVKTLFPLEFYTHKKVFVHSGTILDYVPKDIDKFQYIFENDLNYSIEKFKSEGSWDKMWRSVDEKLIRKWRDDYRVTHVIRENELHLDFPVVYENEHYTIYDLRLLDNSHDGHKI